jgi:gamma-glutamylcyclotransferase (GGCT)/AIG2-like uncharacterized protein YtfP
MSHLPFFVYGTLRPGQSNHRLVVSALHGVREARLPCHRLYAAGIPYVAESRDPGCTVAGELLLIRLDEYETARVRLDRLEGYRPPACQMYVRTACRVEFREHPGGLWRECDAWVYRGGADFDYCDDLLVPGGDWVASRHAA